MYDPNKKLYSPDFGAAPPQQGWQDMGEDQPIDMGPAAGAFKQRFMQKPNAGDMANVPSFDYKPETMEGIGDAGGGAPIKKGGLKSL